MDVGALAGLPRGSKPLIVEIDGLEFEQSVWDPTPVEWNKSGSWAKDEALTEYVLAGLRAALLDKGLVEWALVREAMESERAVDGPICKTYWGSHGCDRPKNHPGLCVCGTLGNECSAIFKWGTGDTAILWWGDEEAGLRLCSLHWTWFS